MRMQYTIQLAVEVARNDPDIVAALHTIVREHAQEIYSQSTFMSKLPVELHIRSVDDYNGIVNHPVFTEVVVEDYSQE